MLDGVPRDWHPYLTGKCFDFALALHQMLPGSTLVACGSADWPDHVAVQLGEHYIDIRGPMPFNNLVNGIANEQDVLNRGPITVTIDQVALHCGLAGRVDKLPVAVKRLARQRLSQFAPLLDKRTMEQATCPSRKMKRTLYLKVEVEAAADCDPMQSLSDAATWAEVALNSCDTSSKCVVTAYSKASDVVLDEQELRVAERQRG